MAARPDKNEAAPGFRPGGSFGYPNQPTVWLVGPLLQLRGIVPPPRTPPQGYRGFRAPGRRSQRPPVAPIAKPRWDSPTSNPRWWRATRQVDALPAANR